MHITWMLTLFLSCLVAMTVARHDHHRHQNIRQQLLETDQSSNGDPFVRGGWKRHDWDTVARDLGWFQSDIHNPFLSSFFSMGPRPEHKPWWQGPNVCESKTEEYENATESEEDILVHYTSTSQTCDLSESAYKCQLVEKNVDGGRLVTIVYECCHGYHREEGEFGCPHRLDMKDLTGTAHDLDLTEFLQAVKMLELTNRLKTGNWTVLAPVNGAFGLDTDLITTDGGQVTSSTTKFLQDQPAVIEVSEPALERTIKTLQGAILGHVIPGVLRSSSMEDEEVLDSVEGTAIRINYFSRPAKLMTANCVPVVSRDNMATNGVIHTMEKALKPVTDTLLDLVTTRPDLTLLKTVLAAAEYVPHLAQDGKLTLLAPTNGAFQKMSRRLRERLLSGDKKCIESVLLNHLLPNVICSAAFQKHTKTLNLLGQHVDVTRTDDGKLFANDAQVVSKDIMGVNGVMHIIDDVMIPEEALDFLEVLERKGLTELIDLVEVAGLTNTLQTAKNATLLAPTNEALQKLSVGFKSRLISDRDLLKQLLTYHVSPRQPNLVRFHGNQLISTLEGRQIRLNRYVNSPFFESIRTAQCSVIQSKPISTCNGNIHLISQVMTPPTGNVVDVLSNDKRFSTLIGYLKKADLEHTLSGTGPFTILAPNNQAFDRMSRRSLRNLEMHPHRLAGFIKTHVIRGTLCCAGIPRHPFGSNKVRTMSGDLHRVTLTRRGEPMVGHVRIATCDKTANNGNILEVDHVLTTPRHRMHLRPWEKSRRFMNLNKHHLRFREPSSMTYYS